MSSDGDLSIQGTLEETTVPDLFRNLLKSSETAVVSLDADQRHDTIYFADGKIVFATTSDDDLGLAEVLLESGELNLDQYRDALERSTGAKKIGTILCELGYLKTDELIRAVERQVTRIVSHALAFRSGSYTIEFLSELGREIVTLQLPTDRVMLDGVARIGRWSLISRGVGKLERILSQAPDADRRIYHLDLTDEESHVYSLLSEPLSVAALCERSYLSNFVTCRTAWALLSVNLLDDAATEAADRTRAEYERELELEAAVERYNSAYQSIYAIVHRRIGDYIHDFVDRIVVHLSPEVLPYLSGVNLLNEGRIDFDQLLNNLIASGSEDRMAIVNNVLNELLYAWILEIRKEFGTDLEGEISPVVASIRK
jgi:hypothetical protein